MSEEFQIGSFTYRENPMDTRIQLHVCRRVTPLVTTVPAMLASGDLKATGDLMAAIGPFAEALAGMEDKDVDYILDKCLSVVERKMEGDRQWAKVWSSPAQRVMFDDIDLATMLKITARVILDVIGPFFPALVQKLNGKAGA